MRIALIVLSALLVAAVAAVFAARYVANGRYQIAKADATSVWRLDTRSGDIKMCFILQMELICVPTGTKGVEVGPGVKGRP